MVKSLNLSWWPRRPSTINILDREILLFCLLIINSISSPILITCFADNGGPLQDTCPTSTTTTTKTTGQLQEEEEGAIFFINGFPCKNPAAIVASDFKTSEMKRGGDTDNFLRSSTSIITAREFPGLNTLGLSIARTDIDVDGMVQPHSHPRASELLYVRKGVVVVGFVDTGKQVFQKTLREGDVFMFPRGLLHYSLNAGFELATIFSVLNSQNPGVVSITDAMFGLVLLDEADTSTTYNVLERLLLMMNNK
ncbi:germin-like protein subfamily 3 member 4 [Telopea speciosissima]|uniref:germin-like protein subfamily 3 member 4 n=1 Tax=Telopea speciosissima TaxID=54955 RepID=UPI001CC49E27|nr:germin-like protein subfamily 3 member 4 [Telopea speciosissima]